MTQTELLKSLSLFGSSAMASGIVRVHQHDCSGPRSNASFELRKIDPPAVIVEERIRTKSHVFQLRQKVEERIAGLRHQDLIASVAKQAEEIAISFTGARRQNHSIGIHLDSVVGVVTGHGLPCRTHSSRVRIVPKSAGIAQRGDNSCLNRIRNRTQSDWRSSGLTDPGPRIVPAESTRRRRSPSDPTPSAMKNVDSHFHANGFRPRLPYNDLIHELQSRSEFHPGGTLRLRYGALRST